nr:N-lysine methyltransferase KMT5A-like [Hydra vulgaris]
MAGRRARSTKNINAQYEDLCLRNDDPEHLKKVWIDNVIGYGVFVTKSFDKDDAILEYKGEVIDRFEAERRHKIYQSNGEGCFIFDVDSCNFKLSVDATKSSNLGRYVNDSAGKFANCRPKSFLFNGHPRIILVATKFISANTELRYDYNDKQNLSWRSDV